jgi:hypothetical protein
VSPAFTVVIAPDFQGTDDEQSLIEAICINDTIAPLRIDDLAKLVELFPLAGLNPLRLRPLFELRSPAATRDWVTDQEAAVRVPRPRIDQIVSLIVEYSEAPASTNITHLHAWMMSKGYEGLEDELHGLVRGLHALAPESFYFDEGVVALNATPEALYAEIRSTLEAYDNDDLVGPYLSTLTDGENAP